MPLSRPRKSGNQCREDLRLWLLEQGRLLGWSFPRDFHQLKTRILKQFGGRLGSGSPLAALELAFPNETWHPFLMPKTPDGYWSVPENRRAYLRWFEIEMGISGPEGWYDVEINDLYELNGATLVDFHCAHPLFAAKELYPDFDFKPWLFKRAPQSFYADQNQVRRFIEEEAEPTLKIRVPEDWSEVIKGDYELVPGFQKFVARYGSMWKVLEFAKPEVEWRGILNLASRKWVHQQRLNKLVQALFPEHQVESNFLCREVHFSKSKRAPEIDVFIQDLKLGFEYQGGFHRLPAVIRRDEEKFRLLTGLGIRLVIVPEKWDGQLKSLRKLAQEQGVHLPPGEVDVEQIRELRVPDEFRVMITLFCEYRDHHGRAPTHMDKLRGVSIGAWASAQRRFHRKDVLPKERQMLLEEIGFDFAPRSKSIEEKTDAVVTYFDQTRTWPHSKLIYKDLPLGAWIQEIRRQAREGGLPQAVTERLMTLNFDWGRARR